jgi:MFS family permease
MIMDQTNSVTPLVGTIVATSTLSGSEVGWVLNALMLGAAVSIGLTSRAGDKYGHRKVLIVLTILALVGCLLAATATDFWPLVIGRFLSGLGLGGVPLGWGLIRPRATAGVVRNVSLAFSLVVSAGAPLALVASGLMVDMGIPWQAVFWVSFVLYALLLIFALLSPETPEEARVSVRVDWVGGVGIGIWATAFLVAISEGPSRGWASPLVVCAFAVFAVVLIAWIRQQRRTSEPLMSLKNMDVRQTLVGFSAQVAVAIAPAIGLFVGLTVLMQTPTASGFGLGLTPLQTSYVMLAMIPGSAAGYLWLRWGLNHLGPKLVLIISGLGGVLVFLGMAFAHQTVWLAFLWVFGYAAAVLSCYTTGYTLITSSARQDNTGVTLAMQTIVMNITQTIPIAVILNVLVPGPGGFIPESTFVGIFVSCALIISAFVIVWAVYAPKRLTDRHAIDTETDHSKVTIAAH